jgi:putative ABC transport system substrate-binding protein
VIGRRAFIVGGIGAFTAPIAAEAQQAGRPWRIGYLSVVSVETDKSWVAAFRDGLRGLGYREGDNIILEQRHASQQLDRLPELAADLVRLRVDVIVANGTPAILAARNTQKDLPIVITVNADPVGAGLVASLARPGGNITGNADGHADLGPKRLELLKAAVPSASRIAVVWNPATPQAARQFENVQGAAPALGVTVLPFEVGGPGDIDRLFANISTARARAVFIIPDQSWSQGHETRIATLAIKSRLPGSGTVREYAVSGMLMSYGADFHDLWRRAAAYVDKILKGARPAELPVEHPTKFELIINLKTAKALGLTIPPSLLLRADQVIE